MFITQFLARFFQRKDKMNNSTKPQKHANHLSVSSVDTSSTLASSFTKCTTLTATGDRTTPHPKLRAIYDGGYADASARGICIRISNGGAGQTGLIQAWANAFIQHRVACGENPFEIAWYLGDTTESLAMLASGTVDFAITYNAAAEKHCMDVGDAKQRVYVFRDHFILAGPTSNPANLKETEDILTMFNKIVTSGNLDVLHPPNSEKRPPTRFLSRFDKSATNIKESFLFSMIGQVPWALDYSKWYHQYPRFPQEALETASLLSEYTLTDHGMWISATPSVKSCLSIFKMGSDDADDLLLNPAHLLYGTRASVANAELCKAFVEWVVSADGGQKVVEGFSKDGHVLYSAAPKTNFVGAM